VCRASANDVKNIMENIIRGFVFSIVSSFLILSFNLYKCLSEMEGDEFSDVECYCDYYYCYREVFGDYW